MMHRHNNTSGVTCQENQSAATLGSSKGNLNNPFLTPPEAYVKDYLNSYQP
jgi:hypothetical protein